MKQVQNRLAIFLHGLYEGGAERTILNLAQGLAGCGVAVDLVLARAVGPFLPQVPPQVRLVDLQAGRMLSSLPALVGYLRRERPDALLSGIDYTNLIAILARRLAGRPRRLVVVEHNTLSRRVGDMPAAYRRLLPALMGRAYPCSDWVVAVSQGVADDLVRMIGLRPERIRVISNPVITPDVQQKAQAWLEHPWFQPGQPPVLIAVGRLTAQKDFPNLLQAFARLRQARPVRLMILGEGEARPALEAQAAALGLAGEISLPGFVDNPYPYMAHGAVYVLSSQWEGLPTVLIEALYCGLPIVATDCPSGPREILQAGRFGRLVPMGDAGALAAAIEDALDGRVAPAPTASWAPYTLEHTLDQYRQVLFEVSPH